MPNGHPQAEQAEQAEPPPGTPEHPAHGPHGGAIDEIRHFIRRRPVISAFLAGAILVGLGYGIYQTGEYIYERGRQAKIEEEIRRIREELFQQLDQPLPLETPRDRIAIMGKVRRYGDTLQVTVNPTHIDGTEVLRQPFIDIEKTREIGHGMIEGRGVLSVVADDGKLRRYDVDQLLRGDEEEDEWSGTATLRE